MPIYEFRCQQCGKQFETLCMPGDDPGKATCPECGAQDGEKLLSTFCSKGGSEFASGSGTGATASCGSRGGFS